MAYDKNLAKRVKKLLSGRENVTERQMFGGLAWMINGNMASGVIGDDLMVRLEKGRSSDAALAEPHTRLFEMGGRSMEGFIVVAPDGVASDEQLARWVGSGADYASSLPPK
jgi:hypothetical protein